MTSMWPPPVVLAAKRNALDCVANWSPIDTIDRLDTLLLIRLLAVPMLPLLAVKYKLVAEIVPVDWVIEPVVFKMALLVCEPAAPESAMLPLIAKLLPVPVMVALTLPLPEIWSSMLVLTLRTKFKLAPLESVTTPPLPKVPVPPPLPICKVPALTVVVPP